MSRYAVPCGTIVFCLIAYGLTMQFDRVPPILLRGMQPEDFPQMVLLLIMALSIMVMIFDRPEPMPEVGINVWTSIGLFVVFALVAQIDLFLGLGVFAGSLAWTWGERRPWGIGLVAVISPAVIFFLFDQAFRIRFPRGLLTNLWYG